MASSGSDTHGISVIFSLEEAPKVSIHMQVQMQMISWPDNGPLVLGLLEAAQDGLCHGGMGLLGFSQKSSNLTYRKHNVWTRVGAQVKKHANNGMMVPCLFHGSTISVCTQGG